MSRYLDMVDHPAHVKKLTLVQLGDQVKSISSGTAPDAIPIIAQNPTVQDPT